MSAYAFRLVLFAIVVVAGPLAADGQAPPRVPTIGVLAPGSQPATGISASEQALERGLQELGWLPGKTIRVEYHYADGKQTRLDELARGGQRLPEYDQPGLETAAVGLGLQLQHVEARRPSDLDTIFADIAAARVGALLVRADPLILEPNAKRLLTLAIKHRLPAIYWPRSYTEAGGLMSYGADLIEVHRRSGFYVHRILQGARPADLPVEEPTRLVLVLNFTTARAIGLTFPPDVRARADEILQ